MDGTAGGNLQLTALLGRFLDMGKMECRQPGPPGRPVPPTQCPVKVGKVGRPRDVPGDLLTRLLEDKLEDIRSKWLSWRSGKKRKLLSLIGKLSHVAKNHRPGTHLSALHAKHHPTRLNISTTGCTLTTTLSRTWPGGTPS